MVTEAEVRNRIMVFADGEAEPALTSADLDLIISISKSVDRNHLQPQDTGWEPTYNIYYAVAQAWLLKASRLAPRYLFMSGGKMFSRQQFYDHCMKQYKLYIGKSGIRGLRLASNPLGLDLVPNNANV